MTIYNSSILTQNDLDYLKLLICKLYDDNSIDDIKELLADSSKKPRNSIIRELEFDIKGFYDLEQDEIKSIVPVKKFRNKSRDFIYSLLIDRLSAVKVGDFELPENIYEILTLRVRFGKRLIDVIEIHRKHWEYILYKSTYYDSEYFVEIVYDGIATYTKLKQISLDDSASIPKLNVKQIEELIMKYK